MNGNKRTSRPPSRVITQRNGSSQQPASEKLGDQDAKNTSVQKKPSVRKEDSTINPHYPNHSVTVIKHDCVHPKDPEPRTPVKKKTSTRPSTRRHPLDMPDPLKSPVRSKMSPPSRPSSLGPQESDDSKQKKRSLKSSKRQSSRSDVKKRSSSSPRDSYTEEPKSLETNESKGNTDSIEPSIRDIVISRESENSVKVQLPPSSNDYEYLQFLLRITEDIIRNDLYTNRDMKTVCKSHFEANKGILNENKMRAQIRILCNELGITISRDESPTPSREVIKRRRQEIESTIVCCGKNIHRSLHAPSRDCECGAVYCLPFQCTPPKRAPSEMELCGLVYPGIDDFVPEEPKPEPLPSVSSEMHIKFEDLEDKPAPIGILSVKCACEHLGYLSEHTEPDESDKGSQEQQFRMPVIPPIVEPKETPLPENVEIVDDPVSQKSPEGADKTVSDKNISASSLQNVNQCCKDTEAGKCSKLESEVVRTHSYHDGLKDGEDEKDKIGSILPEFAGHNQSEPQQDKSVDSCYITPDFCSDMSPMSPDKLLDSCYIAPDFCSHMSPAKLFESCKILPDFCAPLKPAIVNRKISLPKEVKMLPISEIKPSLLSAEVKVSPISSAIVPSPISPETKPSLISADVKTSSITPEIVPTPISPEIKPSSISADVKPSPISSEIKPSLISADVKTSSISPEIKLSLISPEVKPSPISAEIKPSRISQENEPTSISEEDKARPISEEVEPSPTAQETKESPTSQESEDLRKVEEDIPQKDDGKKLITVEYDLTPEKDDMNISNEFPQFGIATDLPNLSSFKLQDLLLDDSYQVPKKPEISSVYPTWFLKPVQVQTGPSLEDLSLRPVVYSEPLDVPEAKSLEEISPSQERPQDASYTDSGSQQEQADEKAASSDSQTKKYSSSLSSSGDDVKPSSSGTHGSAQDKAESASSKESEGKPSEEKSTSTEETESEDQADKDTEGEEENSSQDENAGEYSVTEEDTDVESHDGQKTEDTTDESSSKYVVSKQVYNYADADAVSVDSDLDESAADDISEFIKELNKKPVLAVTRSIEDRIASVTGKLDKFRQVNEVRTLSASTALEENIKKTMSHTGSIQMIEEPKIGQDAEFHFIPPTLNQSDTDTSCCPALMRKKKLNKEKFVSKTIITTEAANQKPQHVVVATHADNIADAPQAGKKSIKFSRMVLQDS